MNPQPCRPSTSRYIAVLLFAALLCCFCIGCAHRAAVSFAYLPSDAFTVPESSLHKVKQDDGSIPRYWGEPIRSLKPLRVYDDHVNFAVVTEERPNEEHGVYFYVPSSSYAPVNGPGRKFSWDEKTEQLHYVFKK